MTEKQKKDIKIKVCGMRDMQNIRELTELPIDYIGFIFYPPSPRYVGENFDKTITDFVPGRISKVGVFVDETLQEVLRKAETYGLDTVQLHGSEIPDYCGYLRDRGLKVIKAFKVHAEKLTTETMDYRFVCDYLLFDTPSAIHGGSGQKFDWTILKQQKFYNPFFLSGGIAPGNENEIKQLDVHELVGVDINSRFEISPGLKNIESIKEFVKNFKSN